MSSILSYLYFSIELNMPDFSEVRALVLTKLFLLFFAVVKLFGNLKLAVIGLVYGLVEALLELIRDSVK